MESNDKWVEFHTQADYASDPTHHTERSRVCLLPPSVPSEPNFIAIVPDERGIIFEMCRNVHEV